MNKNNELITIFLKDDELYVSNDYFNAYKKFRVSYNSNLILNYKKINQKFFQTVIDNLWKPIIKRQLNK